MPGVPPINPQLLMALAQKFGGIAPVVNPGSARRGSTRTPALLLDTEAAAWPNVARCSADPPCLLPVRRARCRHRSVRLSGLLLQNRQRQRGAKTTYDPDGGYVEEDNDGTKRVFDKDNKLIDTIIPPGSPGAGTWQPPAEAKKPGIWDRLTDPA
jgi:hypothetical protein